MSAHEHNYMLKPKPPPVTLSVSPYMILFPRNANFSQQNSTESSKRYSFDLAKQSSTDPHRFSYQNSVEYDRSYCASQRAQNSCDYPNTYYSDKKFSELKQKGNSSVCTKQSYIEYPQIHSTNCKPEEYSRQSLAEAKSREYIGNTLSDHQKLYHSDCTKENSKEFIQKTSKNRRKSSHENHKRYSVGYSRTNGNGSAKRSSYQFTAHSSVDIPEHQSEHRKQTTTVLQKEKPSDAPKRNGKIQKMQSTPHQNGNGYPNPLAEDQLNHPLLLNGEASLTHSKHSSYVTTSETNPEEIIQMSSTSLHTVDSRSVSEDGSKAPYVQEKGSSQVPVAGGLFVATVIGSPVCVVAGIKLGMFAAIAGGIMGYTTGKMFADHE